MSDKNDSKSKIMSGYKSTAMKTEHITSVFFLSFQFKCSESPLICFPNFQKNRANYKNLSGSILKFNHIDYD